jgi:hypothetical protein
MRQCTKCRHVCGANQLQASHCPSCAQTLSNQRCRKNHPADPHVGVSGLEEVGFDGEADSRTGESGRIRAKFGRVPRCFGGCATVPSRDKGWRTGSRSVGGVQGGLGGWSGVRGVRGQRESGDGLGVRGVNEAAEGTMREQNWKRVWGSSKGWGSNRGQTRVAATQRAPAQRGMQSQDLCSAARHRAARSNA